MASSSLSQESLDREDYEINARRTRIRTQRARGALHRTGERETWNLIDRDGQDQNGDTEEGGHGGYSGVIPEHDSPTRSSAASRAKDKRNRPNHLHKGKLPKDKRKLREKRRSTGVVHLASTESTGDSLDDDDDDDEKNLLEARRNTSYNEIIDADNPQTPSEVSRAFASRGNKSPSDLEADLEDNQDYDSCVSQSETNLTLIGRSHKSKELNSPKSPSHRSHVLSRYPVVDQSSRPHSSNVSSNAKPTPWTSSSSSSSVLSHSRGSNSRENRGSDSKEPEPLSPNHRVEAAIRPVSSILARYQAQEKKAEGETTAGGYSYRSRYQGVRGPLGQQFSSAAQKDDEKKQLEKSLERERDENKRLQKVVEEKDRRIAQLEREVALLNKDIEEFHDDNERLQEENRALIRAVSQLSTNV